MSLMNPEDPPAQKPAANTLEELIQNDLQWYMWQLNHGAGRGGSQSGGGLPLPMGSASKSISLLPGAATKGTAATLAPMAPGSLTPAAAQGGFTGFLSKLGSKAGTLASIMGNMGANRANGRIAETNALQESDRQKNENALASSQMGLASSKQRNRELVSADLFGGPGPGGVGQATNISPETLALIRQNAQKGLAGGDTPQFNYSALPQSNALDAILNYGSMAGSIYGAWNNPTSMDSPTRTTQGASTPQTPTATTPQPPIASLVNMNQYLSPPPDPLWLEQPKRRNPWDVTF